jgi:acyl dehydratase
MTLHFEDFIEGTVFRGVDCTVDRTEMLEYARKNDASPIHLDEEAAAKSLYKGLIASGGYTVMLWYRSAIPIVEKIAFLGGFEWHIKLLNPERAGDTLRTEVTITSKKPSSKPGRGYVNTAHQVVNQAGQPVFTCEVAWIVATTPERASSAA